MAGVEGVEPSHTAPETAVLPLDDTPVITTGLTLDSSVKRELIYYAPESRKSSRDCEAFLRCSRRTPCPARQTKPTDAREQRRSHRKPRNFRVACENRRPVNLSRRANERRSPASRATPRAPSHCAHPRNPASRARRERACLRAEAACNRRTSRSSTHRGLPARDIRVRRT